MRRTPSLYVQVLLGVVAGIALGALRPSAGDSVRWLGDSFIRLIKALIAPILFCCIVSGIAHAGDIKKVGRVGLKALVYFELLTTLALALGLLVVHVARPGAGLHVDPASLDAKRLPSSPAAAGSLLEHVVPDNFVGAFAGGEILHVLVLASLTGVAIAHLGPRAQRLLEPLKLVSDVLFTILGFIMRLAPLGAFGAMAFTVAKFGLASLGTLASLMACFYVTAVAFVALVLGGVMRILGLRLWPYLRFIREEIFLVLGTSSSESALPGLLRKSERLGCGASVAGLVIPAGYSFNLDGTSIYLTMAALFVAQATGTQLSAGEEVSLLALLLLTSKGAAAVTGGGFITLAATLATTGRIPVAGLTLLLGIDRFMSEGRAIVNLIGNGIATLVVARWEGELDLDRARAELGLSGISKGPASESLAPR